MAKKGKINNPQITVELEQMIQEFLIVAVLVIDKKMEQVVDATAKDEDLQVLVKEIPGGSWMRKKS